MAATDYTPIYQSAGQAWNVDPTLLQALVQQESGGDPKAVSKAGALGLTQIMPKTAQNLGVTDITDPTQQIYAGAKYLSQALDAEKSPQEALLYYHGGPNWRQNFGPESAAYVPAVTKHYQQIAQAQAPSPGPQGDDVDTVMSRLRAQQEAPTTAAETPAPDPFTTALKGAQTQGTAQSDPFTAALTAAQKASAPPPEANGPPSPAVDQYGLPVASNGIPQIISGAKDIGSAIAQGAEEGFGNGPLGLSQQSQTGLANAGIYNKPGENNPLKSLNAAVINPLAAGADLALRTGSALFRGGQAGVAQTGATLGAPGLGRDLAAIPEAFMGDAGTLRAAGDEPAAVPTGAGAPPEPYSVTPQQVLRQTAKNPLQAPINDTASNPLVHNPAAVSSPAFVPPGSDIPAAQRLISLINADNQVAAGRPSFMPPDAAQPPNPLSSPKTVPYLPEPSPPVAQSVGAAAASPEESVLSPQQAQAYRSTAEGQKLLEPQPPGLRDANAYVPGVTPNAAEIEQQVNTARELKALNMTAPDVSQAAKEIAAANNDARSQYLQDIVGSKVDLQNAEEARAAQATQNLEAAWQNKAPVDATPVLQSIDATLNGPEGKITPVRTALTEARNALLDNDGNLETDPERLYGARKQISFLLSKKNLAANPAYGDASVVGALRGLQQQLDGVIENGAPGYGQYLQDYTDASRPIDQMEVLQSIEPKLYDAQNRMTYNSVQRAMKQIVTARMAPGINPYKSIGDDTMQQLWNLRDDLRRSASAQELSRAQGSDTAQNAWDIGRQLATTGALHVGANLVSPGLGSLAVQGIRHALSPLIDSRAARKRTARGMELLKPPVALRAVPNDQGNPLQR